VTKVYFNINHGSDHLSCNATQPRKLTRRR